jgi:hypothetical protein
MSVTERDEILARVSLDLVSLVDTAVSGMSGAAQEIIAQTVKTNGQIVVLVTMVPWPSAKRSMRRCTRRRSRAACRERLVVGRRKRRRKRFPLSPQILPRRLSRSKFRVHRHLAREFIRGLI